MRLITGPLSMFGWKVEIALLEKGLTFERELVPFSLTHFYSPTHPDVERLNPKRQVPVLQHDDLEIFDSTLIFDYLDDAFPDRPLWPGETRRRAEAKLFEMKVDEVFFPSVQMFMPHKARDFSDTQRDESLEILQAMYGDWDEQLAATGDYFFGDFGYADIAAFMAQFFATFLGHGPDRNLKALEGWTIRMGERASVSRAISEIAAYLQNNQ